MTASISRPRPIAGLCSLCGADAGRLGPGVRCAECAPRDLWFPRAARPVLTPWYEKVSAVIWLGLSLGYFLTLLAFGVWWRGVQGANQW